MNRSLYPVTFMAQASGKGRCCPHCLEPDHIGDDCALSPRSRQERQQRQRSPAVGFLTQSERRSGMEPRSEAGSGGRAKIRAPRQSAQRIVSKVCYSFNDGECRFPNTWRYLHICQRCGAEDHPACRCTAVLAGRRDQVKP